MNLAKTQTPPCVLIAAVAAWLVMPAAPQGGYTESGIASWYGYPYHGRFAASGELYDMEDLTAAHPTLPFNTLVRVINVANDRSIQVRITDRGPFVDGRIIDLSRAAARSLGLMEAGTAKVRLEVVGIFDAVAARLTVPSAFAPPPPPPSAPGAYAIQTGAFRNPENAQRHFAAMQSRYGTARLVAPADDGGIWRVMIGAEATRESADALSVRIRHDSGENNAFVVRLDSSNEPDRPGQSPRPRGTVVADGLHSPSN